MQTPGQRAGVEDIARALASGCYPASGGRTIKDTGPPVLVYSQFSQEALVVYRAYGLLGGP